MAEIQYRHIFSLLNWLSVSQDIEVQPNSMNQQQQTETVENKKNKQQKLKN